MWTHLLTLALCATAAASEPSHPIHYDDYFTLDTLGSVAVDRAGTRVVYVRHRWDKAADRELSSLWMVDTRKRTSERLTFGAEDAWSPVFSEDSAWIYYLTADPAGTTQVFRVGTTGGTPQQLTQAEHGVGEFQLGRDGTIWYATSRTERVSDAFSELRAAHGEVWYTDTERDLGTVRRVDPLTWRDEPEFEPGAHIIELAVSPDARTIALLTAPDDALITHEGGSEVLLYDRNTERITRLPDALWRAEAPSPYGWLLGLAWSSDSRALAFRVDFDGYPGETFVAELAGGEARTWRLPRPPVVTPEGSNLRWVPGQRELCQPIADRARVRLLCTNGLSGGATSRTRILPDGDVVISDYAFSADGRDILAVASTPDALPELYRLPARGYLLPVRLTEINPHTADWQFPKVQLVSWTSTDGVQVEGVLETPAGWTPADGPLPLLLQVHGGPTAHTPYARRFTMHGHTSVAATGWALLSPNYRGSVGYGDAFLTELVGRENEIEVQDLLSGVDAMISRGIADPDRLAVSGWSNGGYLTNCLISQTPRFRAAISGAGVFDQTMQWALEDTPGHVINYLTGLPWVVPEEALAASPLYRAGEIRTPTLIHFGEHDPRVPSVHGRALHRALTVYNQVPAELIVYPGAGHGLTSWSQRHTKMAWDHAWLSHWVKPAAPAAP